jgi:Ulp1 family protease
MLYGECVWEELCNFSLKNQIKNGKTKIGIIFNTDPHNKPGQHWISMFINIKKRQIFFFDSTGDKPAPEIMVLVERIKKEGENMTPKIHLHFDSNEGVEHQYGNTECGVYSLFFIVHMLEDKLTEHYLKTHILKDEYMNKFRHVYFNDSL